MGRPASTQRVEAVERALTLLEAFADGAERLSLADLTRATGYYRSTILRLGASLQRMGYLNRDDDGYYRLGPTLWRLGSQYERSFRLADYVRPALARVKAATGETAAFFVREGDRRTVLYRDESDRPTRHHLEEGAVLPLELGAGGRVLAAFTDGSGDRAERIRTDGYYYSDGERDPETAAVAVPVFGLHGAFVGALAASGPRTRVTAENHRRIRDVLLTEAAKLSTALGRPDRPT